MLWNKTDKSRSFISIQCRPTEVKDLDLNVADDDTFLPAAWLCKEKNKTKQKQQLFPAPFCHWAVASTITVATCSVPSYCASFSGQTECEYVSAGMVLCVCVYVCSEVTVLSNITQWCQASVKHLLVAFKMQYFSEVGGGALQHTVIKKHRLQQFFQAASRVRGNYDGLS